ncbi:uncharacterized protein LOC121244866 [Juglans microcarpa x Juglans regia]|uniref:uncharacterized protein LOC121244866 n=1 Tax=Juglans microcarpa x Juglans regia TaxID=2249226 RepID=UPI001B7F7532|nr:uncharacterized protein LOC121244866 [Juglans microcarpa x Juglans regia]
MAAFMSMKTTKTKKMKRKDLELDCFHDDFSDLSLSSPARKIRRLDAELPPIMEEEPEIPRGVREGVGVTDAFELESEYPFNDEKAIVLFKPLNRPPLLHSPASNLSFSVDSHIMSGFKNQLFGSNQYSQVKSAEEEEPIKDENNSCLAVVPWVPSQRCPAPATEVPQLMEEAEEMVAAMDIEEDNNKSNASIEQSHPSVHNMYGGIVGSDGLYQWQQQHCMIPQLSQNTYTPISWFR